MAARGAGRPLHALTVHRSQGEAEVEEPAVRRPAMRATGLRERLEAP